MTPLRPLSIRGVIAAVDRDLARPMAAQMPPAEFVKRWAPGGESTVTLRLHAEVHWQPGMPQDLAPEEQSEFNAGVIAGMRELASALGVIPETAGPHEAAHEPAIDPLNLEQPYEHP